MPLDLTQLRELLAAINQTDITELTLKSDDYELTVRRESRVVPATITTVPSLPTEPESVVAPPAPAPTTKGGSFDYRPGDSPATATQSALPPTNERRWVEILSPMVGTFYRAPAPDEPAFVEVGDRIRLGQTVCIIEAMKLMNELEAEVAGEVLEILVQNGSPVEYEQPLMRILPG
ncbi:acetyl-CoA carboxylase biotin carboxyl carrier protein [Pantanalinema rosaneae CENA516]|uniref:acetyl-CoA carboxylase biotin carboxyl carrier protein n=1 Tax=Pantanalinema rosaneae TaxID=1620701 RepID=UPI003D6FC000